MAVILTADCGSIARATGANSNDLLTETVQQESQMLSTKVAYRDRAAAEANQSVNVPKYDAKEAKKRGNSRIAGLLSGIAALDRSGAARLRLGRRCGDRKGCNARGDEELREHLGMSVVR